LLQTTVVPAPKTMVSMDDERINSMAGASAR